MECSMRRRILLMGLLILLFSVMILGAPFSSDIASIAETYGDCQKGTDDLRAAFLMAGGQCEPAKIFYYGLLTSSLVGIIIFSIGLIKKSNLRETN